MASIKRRVCTAVQQALLAPALLSRSMAYVPLCLSIVFLFTISGAVAAQTAYARTNNLPAPAAPLSKKPPSGGATQQGYPPELLEELGLPPDGTPAEKPPEAVKTPDDFPPGMSPYPGLRDIPRPPDFSGSKAGSNADSEDAGDAAYAEDAGFDAADETASPSLNLSDTASDTGSDTGADTAEKKTETPLPGSQARNSSDNQTSNKAKSPAALQPGQNQDTALEQYALIIDKNLFSPERKKWVTPPAGGNQAGAQLAKKTLDELVLFGTIISPQGRYAVLRTKKTRKSKETTGGFQPYTLGDYIAGYLIKEIDAKKVTLVDESENQEYTVFFNAEQQVRQVEKTALKAVPPKPVVPPGKRRRAVRKRLPRKPPVAPAVPAPTWGR